VSWLRKAFYLSGALMLLFAGLWLVVVNDQRVSLNLLFLAVNEANAGMIVLGSFMAGSLVGLLVGFNLFGLLKLNTRLYWLKREVRQLQDALGKNRES
jgi:uncharacterized integral membrane protein